MSAPVAFGATDANGDALTYTVPGRGTVGGPSHGTVTIDQVTGTFTYDPDDAYALTGGTDTFTYTVSDAGAWPAFFGIPLSSSPTSATGTVAVTLNRVNVAPVINGDTATVVEDMPVTIAVLGNDADANGNPLAVTGVTQATNGTTTFTASGVTYTPTANFNGTDTFTYSVSDGISTARPPSPSPSPRSTTPPSSTPTPPPSPRTPPSPSTSWPTTPTPTATH